MAAYTSIGTAAIFFFSFPDLSLVLNRFFLFIPFCLGFIGLVTSILHIDNGAHSNDHPDDLEGAEMLAQDEKAQKRGCGGFKDKGQGSRRGFDIIVRNGDGPIRDDQNGKVAEQHEPHGQAA